MKPLSRFVLAVSIQGLLSGFCDNVKPKADGMSKKELMAWYDLELSLGAAKKAADDLIVQISRTLDDMEEKAP